MIPTVEWRDDGTPVSPRFGDIYRSAGADGAGGLAQARHVFLHGCGLLPTGEGPAIWADAGRWAVLETGFGLGLNFLATWHAWREDGQRPARLLYSAVEAFPPEPDDLIRSAAPFPALAPLAALLADQWHGLLPGVHRLRLEGERVQLTLAVADVKSALAELSGQHDAIYLDGFAPTVNPDMWSLHTLKAVARLARRGARAATWCVAREVREYLVATGFDVERVPGLPPKRHALQARYAPCWPVRHRTPADAPPRVAQPARCAVIGAGLAGASVAHSLAQRGWQVTVLDRAPAPAAGASGLPAGVVAPHVSPDDRPLSRLTRAGVRATFDRARLLLREGIDYGLSGVLERHAPGERRVPEAWQEANGSTARRPDTRGPDDRTTAEKAAVAGISLDAGSAASWHARAGWIRPAALVRAMLQAPGVDWRGGAQVAHLQAHGTRWRVLDARHSVLAEAELVFVTAGFDSLALLHSAVTSAPPLHALRGQAAWGAMPQGAAEACIPPFPVNGQGSLIGHLQGETNPWWITGATFERGRSTPDVSPQDHAANRQRLAALLPHAAQALEGLWNDGRVQAWAAVRATLPDRLPAVGAWDAAPASASASASAGRVQQADSGGAPPTASPLSATPALPLHLLTGLGARGLTLAVLCGDLAAAQLHGEPLPVAQSLARPLRAARWLQRA